MEKRMKVMRWCTAVATVLVLLLLAWQCVDLYLQGNRPSNVDTNGVHLSPVFTVALVEERLQPIFPVLAGYGLLVLAALILQSVAGEDKGSISIPPENRLRLMKSRVEVLPPEAQALERRRRNICLSAAAAIGVCALPCLLYLLNGDHFRSWDLEQVMGQLILHIVPWVAVAFAIAVVASVACGRCTQAEIDLLRGHLGQPKPEESPARRCPLGAVRICLYAVAVAFIVLGVMNGGVRDVLVKAINICTECIGLG